jgi:cobalamin biosynthesis Mg chelatase CobN
MVIATGVKANKFKLTETINQVIMEIQQLPLDEEDLMLMQGQLLKDVKAKGLNKDSTVEDYLRKEAEEVDEMLDDIIENTKEAKKKNFLDKIIDAASGKIIDQINK